MLLRKQIGLAQQARVVRDIRCSNQADAQRIRITSRPPQVYLEREQALMEIRFNFAEMFHVEHCCAAIRAMGHSCTMSKVLKARCFEDFYRPNAHVRDPQSVRIV